MPEEIDDVVRAEIELDGHIYVVEYDSENNVVSRDELDGETVIKIMLAVLSDAFESPFLDKILAAKE